GSGSISATAPRAASSARATMSITADAPCAGIPGSPPGKRRSMRMCGIRISLVFAFLVLFEEGYTQSCSLACADTECGELNVAFTPQGGPAFCEGDTITFVNASDPGF